ncbi:MAG: sulfatase-like hydrolase/transferase [Gammaproteobacteria bacterium]|nr:sulfatase-like hydrolase/transferase [Gammaproteobacteria bacterium]
MAPLVPTLRSYFFLAYLSVLAIAAGFLRLAEWGDGRGDLFLVLVFLSYPAIYLLPAWVLARGAAALGGGAWRRTSLGLAVFGVSATELLLLADQKLFSMFGFHVNGFVWNLLTTKGGFESMGGDDATAWTYGGIAAAVVLAQLALMRLLPRAGRLRRALEALLSPCRTKAFLVLLLLATVGERLIYGVSQIQGHGPVLAAANAFPAYQPLRFRRLGKLVGLQERQRSEFSLKQSAALNYPAKPLATEPPAKAYNVLMLVSESLRADMLRPEIMPATWKFAENAQRYEQHFSGSNGTRMGLFSLFYGLYGNYWFPMLNARRGPVLLDRAKALNYRLLFQTSSKFTYPEFDLTLFAQMPKESLHEAEKRPFYWEQDRAETERLLNFIAKRDPKRPFFAFQFFLSPHANYFFPDESVIRPNYLKDFNYATTDIPEEIAGIKDRYVNAVHHLDQQLARVFDYLEKNRLLDSTIVLVTGDHGEEFLEKGFWGHNSTFTTEQTQVPFVLHIPGLAPAVHTGLSSHLDVAPTLMPYLGVKNPAGDYALGNSLVNGPRREHTVFADWDRVALMDEHYKLILPVKTSGYTKHPVTDRSDRPIADAEAVYQRYQKTLVEVMQGMKRFQR